MFGVWAPHEDVAKLAYFGLYALQHRGQESAGIAVSDGSRIVVHKEMGLVAQVFDEPALTALRGHIAVGHCRYSTTGASVWANAQPTFRSTGKVSLALGHNGNLINTRELATLLGETSPGSTGIEATSDTDILTALFLSEHAGAALARPAEQGGQFAGVDQVPVVPQRQADLAGGAEGRLRVGPDRSPGGRVPAVAHRDVAAERGQGGLVEYLGDQAHLLMHHDAAAVADGDARGPLAPVLQRVQAEVGELGHVLVGGPYAEYAAGISWRPVLGDDFVRQTTVWGCH